MPFDSPAQILVVEPMVHDEPSESQLEVVDNDSTHFEPAIETSEPMDNVVLLLEDVPGAGSPGPIEVVEPVEEVEDEDEKEDKNDAKAKKDDKWDWSSKGSDGFITWIKERFESVPKHSGYDTAGLERAVSYLERLDNEISKAMRLDLDGALDANKIEEVRANIDSGIERLHERLDKIKSSKKKSRKKKADLSDGLVKEAQKITGVQGIFVTVPLLISRIARVCINGMVSAGHDIEDLYDKQVKKYKLSAREQAEVMQLLSDMGYNLRQDRGYLADEDVDTTSSNNLDWNANYAS